MNVDDVWYYQTPHEGELREVTSQINLEADPDIHSSSINMSGETLDSGEVFVVLRKCRIRRESFFILTRRGLKDCNVYYINRDSKVLVHDVDSP